jgi:hypothetical protein
LKREEIEIMRSTRMVKEILMEIETIAIGINAIQEAMRNC